MDRSADGERGAPPDGAPVETPPRRETAPDPADAAGLPQLAGPDPAPRVAAIVVITGANGAGKTNLLEAISLLGPGRGLRGAKAAELARRDAAGTPLPWAAAGRFEGPWGGFDIGTGTPEDGTLERRVIRLDGAPQKSRADLADRVAAVWLTPQMDRLFQDARQRTPPLPRPPGLGAGAAPRPGGRRL